MKWQNAHKCLIKREKEVLAKVGLFLARDAETDGTILTIDKEGDRCSEKKKGQSLLLMKRLGLQIRQQNIGNMYSTLKAQWIPGMRKKKRTELHWITWESISYQ